jgi:hypothetical protein
MVAGAEDCCHHVPLWVNLLLQLWCGKEKVNETTSKWCVQFRESILFRLFLQHSRTNPAQLHILPIPKEPTRPKNDLWFSIWKKMLII